MPSAERTDPFDDPGTEFRRIEAYIEDLREERATATPQRRTEIGWCIFGARKYQGRLSDASLARRFGEHKVVIHERKDGHWRAVCSCGARFPGRLHEDFTPEQFPSLDGHLPWAKGN